MKHNTGSLKTVLMNAPQLSYCCHYHFLYFNIPHSCMTVLIYHITAWLFFPKADKHFILYHTYSLKQIPSIVRQILSTGSLPSKPSLSHFCLSLCASLEPGVFCSKIIIATTESLAINRIIPREPSSGDETNSLILLNDCHNT